jgi:ABC-2 type transport system ATP-binding protein
MLNSTREIIAENLVKRFGQFTAVDGVSFKVPAGQIFGFLGPNGAGKSTTLSMLTTLSVPTEGRATVGGFDIATQTPSVRRIAGVALQEIGLDPIMRSMEMLTIQGQAFGLSRRDALARANELLAIVKLDSPEVIKRPVGKYSGGMRRRLDLAMALVHQPDILFLDEPTTGLDPASRRDVWAEVRRLNRTMGMTIFLTTQYLEEVDELADELAIINHGKIVKAGTPKALKAELGNESVNINFKSEDALAHGQETLSGMAEKMHSEQHTLRLYMPNAATAVASVVGRLQAAGIEMESLTLTQPTLDDVFLAVTGQRLTVEEAPNKPSEKRGSRKAS